MSTLRLATYNCEWFNALFDDRGRMLADGEPSARHKTSRAEQLAALGTVFAALDADGIMVIEAPDTDNRRSAVKALETFARHFNLRARKTIIGYPSDTEQEIAFLFDPDRISARHDPQSSPDAPRFDTARRFDLDHDGNPESISFSKPPLELDVTTADGVALRLIGMHAKSKAPHGKMSAAEFTRISIENRRKQLSECLWLRARAEAHLAAGDHLIILGDFNDGPGLDEYEKLFGRSGVEIVLGLNAEPALRLFDPNAAMALQRPIGAQPTSARFWLAPQKRYFEALIDFIMLSPDLVAPDLVAPDLVAHDLVAPDLVKRADWRIWHPFNDPGVLAAPGLTAALLAASDHFPVTLDLKL